MKQRWRDFEQRFARLARRERVILLTGGVAVIFILGFSVVDSSLSRQQLLAKEVDKVRADAETSKAQVQVIVGQLARDPDMLARARIAKLSKEARDLDDQMGKINRSLIPPQRMAKILEGMLARDRQVQLVSLKTLPVTTLVERDATDDRANVYKHGIVMTLQGRYLDLLTYLNALEALPWQMFWSQAQMDARDYTAVRVTVTVFTLSLDKDWLVV